MHSRTASSDPDVALVWARFSEVLLGEDFGGHPYWRALAAPAACRVRKLMAPSREYDHAHVMSRRLLAVHQAIKTALPADILGPAVDPGLFFQAWLSLRTRAFHTGDGSVLVPVVDFFNHSGSPGAAWSWDEEAAAMIVTATRAHAVGEHVCISYGLRPNPLLLRTYGFTLPPESEPSWAFVLQGKKPRELYNRYLPRRYAELNIHFDSVTIQNSLIDALNGCYELRHAEDARRDARNFLVELCTHFRAEYEADPLLQAPLAALRRVRLEDPCSGAWWEAAHLFADVEEAVGSAEEAAWAQSCVRIKMSEYLCLTVHIEAAQLGLGTVAEEGCLRNAAHLRALLLDAFEVLESVGIFQCTTVTTAAAIG
mmetsp:Transcript_9959/g.26369  ORF Transcript_9959/g.26369 Transcript_9959/m.26369 type:complete len:369 (+) Transcript_9959:92-1198(+)